MAYQVMGGQTLSTALVLIFLVAAGIWVFVEFFAG